MEWRLNGAQPKEPKAPRQAKAAIQQIHQLWAELRAQQLIGLFFAVGEREGKSTLPSFLHLFFSADGAEEKREEKREERRVAGRFALLHSNQRFPFRLGLPKPNPTTLWVVCLGCAHCFISLHFISQFISMALNWNKWRWKRRNSMFLMNRLNRID